MPRPTTKKMQAEFAKTFARLLPEIIPTAWRMPDDRQWPIYHVATSYGTAKITRLDDWVACEFDGAPPKDEVERAELRAKYPMAVWAGCWKSRSTRCR